MDAIEEDELLLKFDSTASPASVREEVDRTVTHINQYLDWQRQQCEPWTAQLPTLVGQCLTQRLENLRGFDKRMNDLGWPEKPARR